MDVKNAVYVFFHQDTVSIEDPCDYFESLKIMRESDCLVHIDAWFDVLENGSIFFAAKIADYLGAGKPILGITDPKCPAGKIITSSGGECSSSDPYDVAKHMLKMYREKEKLVAEEAEKYAAPCVAKAFDEELRRRLAKDGK